MDLLSDESGDEKELRINKKFASKYEATARFKELQRGKELLEDNESDSDASSEDEDGEALSAGVDVQIMKTINSIRKKDPSIYDSSAKWFEPESDGSGSDSEDADVSTRKQKKQTYKDVLREQLLRDGADDDDDTTGPQLKGFAKKNASMSYDPEQEKLRRAFLESVNQNSDSDSDNGNDIGQGGNDLLVARHRGDAGAKEVEAQRALNAEMDTLVELGRARGAPDAAKDAFLVDYFKAQKWKGHDIQTTGSAGRDSDSDSDSGVDMDDDEEVDRAENFESKYNFRFQELGADGAGLRGLQVTGHARAVEGSLRRPDDKRKLQREALRERKEHERRQKEEELKRLKNLKRRELQARLEKIASVGGVAYDDEAEEEEEAVVKDKKSKRDKKNKKNKKSGRLMVDASQLDDDWDPAAHEALMAAQFGDDYYAEEGADADFGDETEAHRYALEAAAEDAGLGWDGEEEDGAGGLAVLGGEEEDVAVEVALPALSKSKRQRNREKKAAKGREANGLGADEDAGLDAAALEELYALDYEDIIGGDTLCRFRYRPVDTQDYGLSVEDILAADDKELNQFRSIKKYSAYRHGSAGGEDAGSRHRYENAGEDGADEASKLSKKRKRLRVAIREREAEEAARVAALVPAAQAVPVSIAPLAPTTGGGDAGSSGEEGDRVSRQPGEKRKRKRKHKGAVSAAAAAAAAATTEAPSAGKERTNKAPPSTASVPEPVPVETAVAKKKRKHAGAKPKAKDPQDIRMSLYR